MMKSEFIAVIYDEETKKVCAIISPDYDEQLNDPAWTAAPNTKMIKLPRGDLKDSLSYLTVHKIQTMIEEQLA